MRVGARSIAGLVGILTAGCSEGLLGCPTPGSAGLLKVRADSLHCLATTRTTKEPGCIFPRRWLGAVGWKSAAEIDFMRLEIQAILRALFFVDMEAEFDGK